MKIINRLNKKISLFAIATLISAIGLAQDTQTIANSGGFTLSLTTILTIIIILFLLIVVILGMVVSKSIDIYKETLSKKISAILVLILMSLSINAQDTTTTASAVSNSGISLNYITILMFLVVALELVTIGYLIKQLRKFSGIEALEAVKNAGKPKLTLWDKFNNARSIEDNDKIDVGHDYDGIRELNNVAPPWFVIGFALSILFAIGYLYRYQVAHSAPNQIEELEIAMQKAKAEQAAYEKLTPQKTVDINNLVILGSDEIAKGKELYLKNCATCHAQDCGGGAGPNLTDDYWLHGGSLKAIFTSITDGYPTKGMPNWGTILKPTQIEEITSFIKSLHGTNPAMPKEKQGELYKEEGA